MKLWKKNVLVKKDFKNKKNIAYLKDFSVSLIYSYNKKLIFVLN